MSHRRYRKEVARRARLADEAAAQALELDKAEQAAAQAVEQEQEQPLPRQNTPPTSASSCSSAPANPLAALVAESEPVAMTKSLVLANNLPAHITAEVKPLLRLQEASAGNTPNHTLKLQLMKIFGPKKRRLMTELVTCS